MIICLCIGPKLYRAARIGRLIQTEVSAQFKILMNFYIFSLASFFKIRIFSHLNPIGILLNYCSHKSPCEKKKIITIDELTVCHPHSVPLGDTLSVHVL